jgi:hypothetical protein
MSIEYDLPLFLIGKHHDEPDGKLIYSAPSEVHNKFVFQKYKINYGEVNIWRCKLCNRIVIKYEIYENIIPDSEKLPIMIHHLTANH